VTRKDRSADAACNPLAALPTIPDYAYPPYAQTAEQRERWRLALGIATEISRQHEGGWPNQMMVWHLTRAAYFSEIPTGSPGDEPPGRSGEGETAARPAERE